MAYFKNLNSLRFIAACFMVLSHTQRFEQEYHHKLTVGGISTITFLGGISLSVLFVLSGFLITYLVIKEKNLTKDVQIGKFYIRRILRIWPLYYLIVVFSYFILPFAARLPGSPADYGANYYKGLGFAILFLPSLAGHYFPANALQPAWTLNIEEPFYLVWPWIVRKVDDVTKLLYGLLAGILAIKGFFIVLRFFHYNVFISRYIVNTYYVVYIFALLAGATGGSLLIKGGRKIDFLFERSTQIALYTLFFLSVLFNVYLGYIVYEYYAVLLTCIVLNLGANSKSIIKLEHPVLSYLGQVSYGIYMYHVAVLMIIGHWFNFIKGPTLYIVIYAASIFIAIVSYEVIERKFLKIKTKYSVVKSSNEASDATAIAHR